MKWIKRIATLPTAALVVALVGPAVLNASTLQALFGGAELAVGNTRFTGWRLVENLSVTPVSFDTINVTPYAPGPDLAGLRYQSVGGLFVPELGRIEFTFAFTVGQLGGLPLLHDSELTLGDFSLSSGFVEVVQDVFDAEGNLAAFLFVKEDTLGISKGSDQGVFAPQTSLNVTTSIKVVADPGATTSLSSYQQVFSIVPEPPTTTLLAMGMCLTLAARRRRKRR